MTVAYDAVRAAVDSSGSDSRVEVNQRALIDKILARYASAGAVYRELLQNSNDAEATTAEILITTEDGTSSSPVSQVVYRNNGMPFRKQDWSRLQKIAEGNPDVNKVGAFGVGAYSMFSICEEPLVISGKEAMAFVWKGDALWTKTAPNSGKETEWTTFVLPSRDPYPVPDLVEFGSFLCSALTFTQCLKKIRVLVNGKERCLINKEQVQKPTVVKPPTASSFWKNDGAVTASPRGLFTLGRSDGSILESVYGMSVTLDGETSSVRARYVSGTAKTKIPADMSKRMIRVTKKKPPSQVNIQIFINAAASNDDVVEKNGARKVTQSFSPQMGSGRVFIGFRTSQTTGLAAHLAAPLVPTVEREAIDFQDPTLRVYNTELLELAGILMRLTLEHSMSLVGAEWEENAAERLKLEAQLEQEAKKKKEKPEKQATPKPSTPRTEEEQDSSSSFMGFAKFMAKGVKKKIVGVMNSVDSIVDDGNAELLNPRDPRPLSLEERHAIILMRSFCPQQSTPDTQVGTALAMGFSRCLPNTSPPVLTRSGVVRGSDARLPYQGMEAFVKTNVVRKVLFENAREYHEVIARCRRLVLNDLATTLPKQVLEEKEVVRLLKWWTKFSRIEPHITNVGPSVKDSIRYFPDDVPKDADITPIKHLKDLLFYVDSKLLPEGLPMPDSVISKPMQKSIGTRTLEDVSLRGWFSSLPMDIWAQFISQHVCMAAGQPEDEKLRILVLSTLSKEYSQRHMSQRVLFGSFLQNILADKRCIPFDSQEPTPYAAERPTDLYLYSAELKAFDGIGSFNKVSQRLKDANISDEFLLSLGVRKSVAIDFLFTNLDTLSWSNDPKPLIEYLLSASLTKGDLEKLRSTQYLPAENDVSRTFAPSELYLPDSDLRVFPFIKLLQWPSEEGLTPKSPNGKFLQKLGCKVHPPLPELLKYVASDVKHDEMRVRCLDYVCQHLGHNGVYSQEYEPSGFKPNSSAKQLRSLRFLPALRSDPLVPDSKEREMHSPNSCFANPSCLVMGFPVLDPELDAKSGGLYRNRFKIADEPKPNDLIKQLLQMVTLAKTRLQESSGKNRNNLGENVAGIFEQVFVYLSTRSAEFGQAILDGLKNKAFIPCRRGNSVFWYRPVDVFFKNSNGEDDSLTDVLFHVIEFSPFLAAAGVKTEATTQDLFRLMIASPDEVLRTLGSEVKYRSLLRRIAANPPFRSVTAEIRNSPFLLAYKVREEDEQENDNGGKPNETGDCLLAKASDVFIIDNSFFGRMFPVLRAPHESDLEDFYVRLGSSYISKGVMKEFEVIGRQQNDTDLTFQLAERIRERRPLLVSPSVTSRPLLSNASAILDDKKLNIFQVVNLKAVYSLGKAVRNQRITCCAKAIGERKNGLFITKEFDWFDVGYAIGGLILQRCQLEDAFFIGSLLEAPLGQLRARGFPVDRILRPAEPVVEEPKPTVAELPKPGRPPETGNAVRPTVATLPPKESAAEGSKGSAPLGSGNAPGRGEEGFVEILKQMYPDASEEFLRTRLGPNPTLDDVRGLAEEMAMGSYPKQDFNLQPPASHVSTSQGSSPDKRPTEPSIKESLGNVPPAGMPPGAANSGALNDHKRKFGKRLSRAFGGIRTSSAGNHSTRIKMTSKPSFDPRANDGKPASPEADAANHAGIEDMLKQTVGTSTKVHARGVTSPETVLQSLPESLDRNADGCEIIPSQNLKPFTGPYRTGKTHNGIRVFSSRKHPSSDDFLRANFHSVDYFADILKQLCGVYSLDTSTCAIYHEPTGSTIAFNSNRALHFNVRFFYALHYSANKQTSSECYAYWFTTMAHELAHHLATGHNKEHGYYTESYVTMFLPKLAKLLGQLDASA